MKEIIKSVLEHQQTAIDKGLIVFGTYLQGSQNYKLDIPTSDIDTKTIVIPKLNEIILNKSSVSTTHVLADNSHDDEKDIRLMFSTFHKQNINFLEILFTEYFVVNPIYENENKELMDMADDIANINNNQLLRCIVGMSYEKLKALKHPYPATVDKIEKFGYDPKQLHHIVRLNEFIKRFTNGESFRDCLISKDVDNLKAIKLGNVLVKDAEIMAAEMVQETDLIRKEYGSEKDIINTSTIDKMNDLLTRIVKKSLREELLE